MKLSDWLQKRTEFVKKAQDRHEERIGLGAAADEDIPYYAKVQDEMLMDLFERVEKIEELYKPAPKTVGEEESRTPRLRLG